MKSVEAELKRLVRQMYRQYPDGLPGWLSGYIVEADRALNPAEYDGDAMSPSDALTQLRSRLATRQQKRVS